MRLSDQLRCRAKGAVGDTRLPAPVPVHPTKRGRVKLQVGDSGAAPASAVLLQKWLFS